MPQEINAWVATVPAQLEKFRGYLDAVQVDRPTVDEAFASGMHAALIAARPIGSGAKMPSYCGAFLSGRAEIESALAALADAPPGMPGASGGEVSWVEALHCTLKHVNDGALDDLEGLVGKDASGAPAATSDPKGFVLQRATV